MESAKKSEACSNVIEFDRAADVEHERAEAGFTPIGVPSDPAEKAVYVMERMADDPDRELNGWEREALAPIVRPGAFTIASRERGPLVVSVDAAFIRAVGSC